MYHRYRSNVSSVLCELASSALPALALAVIASITACAARHSPPDEEAPDADASAALPATTGASDAAADGAPASQRAQRESLPRLCERSGSDAVRDVFCAETEPEVASLADLLRTLGVAPASESFQVVSERTTVALLTGHSTSLSGHVVSPINPRLILVGVQGTSLRTYVIIAFQRGVQQVELATIDRGDEPRLNFYLVRFRQACNERTSGCAPGDLYTPRIEEDWLTVTIEDDEDLKNTRFDCRQCHHRGREIGGLLMRELRDPWTHFFASEASAATADGFPGVTGADLVRDYIAAKGDEAYAGVTTEVILNTFPLFLEALVGQAQPLLFDAPGIRQERWPQGPDGYAREPVRSAIWDSGYAAFKRGEQLALPYFAQRATDPDKQARLTMAYQSYLSGELAAEDLPDLSDIFPDDPQVRAEIGLQTEPGASPAEALVQACGSCHNDVLDQTISRAQFSVALSRMDEAQREKAIDRIERSPDASGVMPPPEARQLDAETRARLIEYLRQSTRSEEDDALLDRAATLGMAGGGQPPSGVGIQP